MMPMSVAEPYGQAIPYFALLAVCLAVLVICLIKIPTLRAYRRRRNLIIYAVLTVIFVLIIYQASVASLGPTYLSYKISSNGNTLYSGQESQFTITCSIHGSSEAHFYVIMQSENATFQIEGQSDYLKMNNTAVKIPFNLPINGEQNKVVHFTVDAHVTSYGLYPSVERPQGSDFLVATWIGEIICLQDPSTNRFTTPNAIGTPVP